MAPEEANVGLAEGDESGGKPESRLQKWDITHQGKIHTQEAPAHHGLEDRPVQGLLANLEVPDEHPGRGVR